MSVDLDSCEMVDVHTQSYVKARVSHKCSCCNAVIKAEENYFRIGIVFDGSAETIKRCMICQTIYEHLCSISARGEAPDLRLDCGHSYEDIHEKSPPPEIAALAFLTSSEFPNLEIAKREEEKKLQQQQNRLKLKQLKKEQPK